ncbi:pentatricopeptide repeat-containing protein At5g48910-like [Carica papaya]|uniref:pentatricopeptide repeat-containing protein At5g48910-like n=1 Tax=Carica papaya TaxID=3649 RepID=UPI000B8D08CF|nr:pentatricopeptide repeat-containing protein At5g48910-like [Carica papaya]
MGRCNHAAAVTPSSSTSSSSASPSSASLFPYQNPSGEREACRFHLHLVRIKVEPEQSFWEVALSNCFRSDLVDIYAKCGRIDLDWDVFENMKEKEFLSWNVMMGRLDMYGRAKDAIELFFKIQRERVLRPNGITLVCVLNGCARARWVDKGIVGLLEEAYELIASMLMKPNAAIWGTLLGACRIHKNVELCERIGKILLEMNPLNLVKELEHYAKDRRWEDVGKLRKLMKERGIRTTLGINMIYLDGIIHEFKMGDGSHPQVKEIHMMLEKIIEKLQMEGYSPNTSQVLFDVSDEEKETTFKYHSKKLAIAFGLLNTKLGTPIHIIKNLRMCEDCHSAIKLISRVYKV